MTINLQVKDADNTAARFPASVPPTRSGYTNFLNVPDSPARAADDTTSVLTYANGAYAWLQPPVTLGTLATALNKSLTTLFKTAPLQAQITYSNITTPIADLITAGQLAAAIAAFQGMIDDDLVPPKYAPLITSAIAIITAQEGAFAAVMPAPPATAATATAAQPAAH